MGRLVIGSPAAVKQLELVAAHQICWEGCWETVSIDVREERPSSRLNQKRPLNFLSTLFPELLISRASSDRESLFASSSSKSPPSGSNGTQLICFVRRVEEMRGGTDGLQVDVNHFRL